MPLPHRRPGVDTVNEFLVSIMEYGICPCGSCQIAAEKQDILPEWESAANATP
jgi:hypothetical protein